MFPYADDTKSYTIPVWVFVLIGLNVLFFMMSYSSGMDHYIRTLFAYGTIPARFVQSGDLEFPNEVEQWISGSGVDQDDWAPPFITLFTSIFLHGGIMHLVGNMWFMWLFADNVEDRFGKLIFPIFYILCGLLAGLLHVMTNLASPVPAIGASGAIAGVMGAYIYLFPKGQIATLITYGWYWRTIQIPAFLYLIIWFGFQLVGGLVSGGGSNVAFWAHIGGFVAGLVFAILLKKMNMVKTYPGDRDHKDWSDFPPTRSRTYTQPRKKKRYVWRD